MTVHGALTFNPLSVGLGLTLDIVPTCTHRGLGPIALVIADEFIDLIFSNWFRLVNTLLNILSLLNRLITTFLDIHGIAIGASCLTTLVCGPRLGAR